MNIKKRSLKENERWFVNELASQMAPWGLPPSAGRVYGYLLLCQSAVSVDEIAEALELSRTGAWNAARNLETIGHVTRYGASGSKRGLYAASENFAAPFLQQTVLFDSIGKIMQTCASEIVTGSVAERLEERAKFWLSARDSTQAFVKQYAAMRDSRTGSGRAPARKKRR